MKERASVENTKDSSSGVKHETKSEVIQGAEVVESDSNRSGESASMKHSKVFTFISPRQKETVMPIIEVNITKSLGEIRDPFVMDMFLDSSSSLNMMSERIAKKHGFLIDYSEVDFIASDIQENPINIVGTTTLFIIIKGNWT